MSTARGNGPTLKDGQALDRLSDKAERWAKKQPAIEDREAFRAEFDARFRPEAESLADQCTLGARPFGVKEWILAVPLWLILAGGVFLLSWVFMQPEGVWLWVFATVAALIFVLGFGAVYVDTTSERRARKRYDDKVEWLLGISRRTAEDVLNKRSGAKG